MDDYPTSEVWLGGLREDLLPDDLREELSRYGTVHFLHIGHHPNRSKPLAYAKVTMGSVAEASRVLHALNGATMPHLAGAGEGLQAKFARIDVAASAPVPHSPLSPRAAALRVGRAGSHSDGGRSAASTPTAAATAAAAAVNGKAGFAAPKQPRCAHCGKAENAAVPLRRCSACKGVAYCSQACQLADWNGAGGRAHASECGTLQALARLLAEQPAVAATLQAALDAPTSGLGRGVLTLLEGRLAALDEAAATEQQAQQAAEAEAGAAAAAAAEPAATAQPAEPQQPEQEPEQEAEQQPAAAAEPAAGAETAELSAETKAAATESEAAAEERVPAAEPAPADEEPAGAQALPEAPAQQPAAEGEAEQQRQAKAAADEQQHQPEEQQAPPPPTPQQQARAEPAAEAAAAVAAPAEQAAAAGDEEVAVDAAGTAAVEAPRPAPEPEADRVAVEQQREPGEEGASRQASGTVSPVAAE